MYPSWYCLYSVVGWVLTAPIYGYVFYHRVAIFTSYKTFHMLSPHVIPGSCCFNPIFGGDHHNFIKDTFSITIPRFEFSPKSLKHWKPCVIYPYEIHYFLLSCAQRVLYVHLLYTTGLFTTILPHLSGNKTTLSPLLCLSFHMLPFSECWCVYTYIKNHWVP